MNARPPKVGDQVFHPQYGFGILESLTMRDEAGQPKEYYGVRLSEGSVLTVPVARAESLGLRRVTNGLATVLACLRSPASSLPDNDRQRVVELKARWYSPEPTALIEAVRDLMARSRSHNLTPADKKWLANACQRLSDEAARVDATDRNEIHAAIMEEVERQKSR